MASPDEIGEMDVAVVGGGVIGLATAWRLATRGAAVTLIDAAADRAATWAAAGMLAPVTEVHYGEERLLQLNLAASAAWPDFAEELEAASDRTVGYRQTGTVVVARDVDDKRALDRLLAFQAELGLSARSLTSRETRLLEPGLAPSTRGGILVEGDHQVDNRALVTALSTACERAGVRFRTARVDAVVSRPDGRSVRLADGGLVEARTIVVAAGWSSAAMGGLPPGSVPVRPVKGQLLHLREVPGMLRLAERVVRGLEVYIVPRGDGRLVVGATVEERGPETTVTAGGVFELLRAARELLPGIGECELVEAVSGLRPGTPDNAPLIGFVADGVLVATGHYRNGILLAPVTAEGVADLIESGSPSALIAPFDPGRFERKTSWSA